MSKNINIVLDISTKVWLNTQEVIAYMGFGCSDNLQKWRDENKLAFTRVGKSIVYRRKDIDKFLEGHMHIPHEH